MLGMRKIFLAICVMGICLSGCQQNEADSREALQSATESTAVTETEMSTETEIETELVTEIELVTELVTEEITEAVTEVETEEETEVVAVDISAYTNAPYNLEQAKEVFEHVNQVRMENGLDALVWDDRLYVTAAIRAEEATRNWSHTRPDGSKWSVLSDVLHGENLAKVYTKDEVVDAWLASPTHKENMLRAEFTRGAIAYYDKDGYAFWAQHFGY